MSARQPTEVLVLRKVCNETLSSGFVGRIGCCVMCGRKESVHAGTVSVHWDWTICLHLLGETVLCGQQQESKRYVCLCQCLEGGRSLVVGLMLCSVV